LHFSCYTFSTFAGASPLDNSTDLAQALILVKECKPSALTELLKLSIQVIFTKIYFHLLKFQWSECLCEHITGIPFEYSNYNVYKFHLLLHFPQINLPVFTLIGLQSDSKVTWHAVSRLVTSVSPSTLHPLIDTDIIISLYNI